MRRSSRDGEGKLLFMARVTLMDVAARAGVSRATASLVLRGTGRVSEKTRQRVFAAMDELDYVYDRVAASLREQRAGIVGVVLTHIENPFFGELFRGLERELGNSGAVPLLASTGDDLRRQDAVLTTLREHQVSGLVVVPASGSGAELVDRLRDWGIGHLFVTRSVPGADVSYLGPDDRLGGRQAGEHLLAHRARRFGYVGGAATMQSRMERLAGLRDAVRAAGGSDEDVADLPGETSGEGGLSIGRVLLEGGELPEAVLCHSDSVALGFYRALHDAGRAHEVRVIGYDDIAGAALFEPPLTSMSVRPDALGVQAARLLQKRMSEPAASPVRTLVAPDLVVRRSCGCNQLES